MLVSEMPHGGFKRSGYGKDLSSDSLQDYSVVRHIMARHGSISDGYANNKLAKERNMPLHRVHNCPDHNLKKRDSPCSCTRPHC